MPTTRRKPRSLDPAVLEHAARTLKVLAHRDRLRIVETLGQKRLSVNELADAIGLPQAATSQHLTQMRAHGILDVERDGRSAYYIVVNPNALAVLDCIRQHAPPGSKPPPPEVNLQT